MPFFYLDRGSSANREASVVFNTAGGSADWMIGEAGGDSNFRIADGAYASQTRLLIDTTTGNVGIGTTGPQRLLHLSKAGVVEQMMTDTTGGTDEKTWDFITDGGSKNFRIAVWNDAYTSGADAFIITRSGTSITKSVFPTGNVGIGTASPTEKLSVTGNFSATGNITLASSATAQSNKALCWLASKNIGYCSNAPDVNGACTCNSINS